MDDDELFSLADLPDELEAGATTSGQDRNHGVAGGAPPSLDLGAWCEGCSSLRQEMDKMKNEHSVNYSMLKEKIVHTDLLIKRYNAKCQESDYKASLVDAANKKLESTQRECDTMANKVKSMLEEGEPLRKAKEKMEKQKENLMKQVDELEAKLKAKEVTEKQLNLVRMEQAKKLDKLEEAQSSQKTKIQDLESSLKKSESALKKAQDDVLSKKKELFQERKQSKENAKVVKRHEVRIAYYESVLIKHGLNYAITSRSGRQSCESSIVSHDLSEDWDDCRSPAMADATNSVLDSQLEDEELARVFKEMGAVDEPVEALMPLISVLSPIPASPAPSQVAMDSDDDAPTLNSLEDDDSSVTSTSDLEDVAGLLEGKLLSSTPDKSAGTSARKSNRPLSKSLQRQLSMDEHDDGLECESPVKLPPKWLPAEETVEEINEEPVESSSVKSTSVSDTPAPNVNGAVKTSKPLPLAKGNFRNFRSKVTRPVGKTAVEGLEEDMLLRKQSQPVKYCRKRKSLDVERIVLKESSDNNNMTLLGQGDGDLCRAAQSKWTPLDLSCENPAPDAKTCDVAGRREVSEHGSKRITRSRSLSGSRSDAYGTLRRSPRIRLQSDSSVTGDANTDPEKRTVTSGCEVSDGILLLEKAHASEQPETEVSLVVNKVSEAVTMNSMDIGKGSIDQSPTNLQASELKDGKCQTGVDDCRARENNLTIGNENVVPASLDNCPTSKENCFIKEGNTLELKGRSGSNDDPMNIHEDELSVPENNLESVSPCDITDDVQDQCESVFSGKNLSHNQDVAPKQSTHEKELEIAQETTEMPVNMDDNQMDSGVVLEDNTDNDTMSNVSGGFQYVQLDSDTNLDKSVTAENDRQRLKEPTNINDPDQMSSEGGDRPCVNVAKSSTTPSPDTAAKQTNIFLADSHKHVPNAQPTEKKGAIPPSLPKQSSTGFDVLALEDSSDFSECDDHLHRSSVITSPIQSPRRRPSKSPKSKSPVRFSLGEAIIEASHGHVTSDLQLDECSVDISVPPMMITESAENMIPCGADLGLDDSFSSSCGSPASLTCVEELPPPISPLSDFGSDPNESRDYLEGQARTSEAVLLDTKCTPDSFTSAQASKPVHNTDILHQHSEPRTLSKARRRSSSRSTSTEKNTDIEATPHKDQENNLQAVSVEANELKDAKLCAEPVENQVKVPKRRSSRNANLWTTVALSREDSADGSTVKSQELEEDTKTLPENSKPLMGPRRRSSGKNAKLWGAVAESQATATPTSDISVASSQRAADTRTPTPKSNSSNPDVQKPANPGSEKAKSKTRKETESSCGNSQTSMASDSGHRTESANVDKGVSETFDSAISQINNKTMVIPKRRAHTRKRKPEVGADPSSALIVEGPVPKPGDKREASESVQQLSETVASLKPKKANTPAVLVSKKDKRVIDSEIHLLLSLDCNPKDTADNLLGHNIKPQGIVEALCKHLLNSSPDVISIWNTRCQAAEVDTSAPWLSSTELKFLKLLRAFSSGQNTQKDDDIIELFLEVGPALLGDPTRHGSLPSGVLAVGKMIIALCRLQCNLERARVLVYDWVYQRVNMFVGLVCVTSGIWREALHKSPGCSPVVLVLEHIILSRLDRTKNKHSMMESILCRLCDWERSKTPRDSIGAQLLADLKGAVSNTPGMVRDYERAVDLLSSHEDWHWCNNVLVVQNLWPILQQWGAGNDDNVIPELLVETTLRLLGLVMSHFPAEGKAATRQTLKTLVALLQAPRPQTISAKIQMAAVQSIVRLSPFDPEQALNCLQTWIQKNKPENQQDAVVIHGCLGYYKSKTT